MTAFAFSRALWTFCDHGCHVLLPGILSGGRASGHRSRGAGARGGASYSESESRHRGSSSWPTLHALPTPGPFSNRPRCCRNNDRSASTAQNTKERQTLSNCRASLDGAIDRRARGGDTHLRIANPSGRAKQLGRSAAQRNSRRCRGWANGSASSPASRSRSTNVSGPWVQ